MLASTGASIHEVQQRGDGPTVRMLRRGQAIVSTNGDWPKGYHHLTGRERCQALKKSGESNVKGAVRPRPRRPDPQRGPAPATISSKPTGWRPSAAARHSPGRCPRWREVEEKLGSAVESGSRGACALRAGSATSGSTSTCGRTGRPAERCNGRHRGKKRNSRARGQAGRGSRGHTSGGGEVAGRGLGRRHGRPSPGRRAVAGGPRLQVHVAGPARRQDGRRNGRSDAQAPGAVQGVRAHNGQRQGVRGPQGGCRGTGNVVLLRAAVPGARPERAHERAGSPVQGDRQAGPRRTAWRICSTTGRARRWTTGLRRKFSSGR